MTQTRPDDGMCQETSGFLFNHPCDRFAIQKCSRCQKRLCDDHSHLADDGVFCTTCLRARMLASDSSDPNAPNNPNRYSSRYYDDDPFFYRDHYYRGSDYYHTQVTSHHHRHGDVSDAPNPAAQNPTSDEPAFSGGGSFASDDPAHDPADFTEGDAESMRHEGDENFETDMGAS